MSISISDIINVSIAVAPNAVATDGFGPLLFMSKEFVPTVDVYPVRQYTSLSAVLADFPTGEIAKAATTLLLINHLKNQEALKPRCCSCSIFFS